VHNIEEITMQGYGHPAEERNERAESPRLSGSNRSMSITECQAEEYSHAIGTLVREYEHELEDENLPRKLSKGVDANSMISRS